MVIWERTVQHTGHRGAQALNHTMILPLDQSIFLLSIHLWCSILSNFVSKLESPPYKTLAILTGARRSLSPTVILNLNLPKLWTIQWGLQLSLCTVNRRSWSSGREEGNTQDTKVHKHKVTRCDTPPRPINFSTISIFVVFLPLKLCL